MPCGALLSSDKHQSISREDIVGMLLGIHPGGWGGVCPRPCSAAQPSSNAQGSLKAALLWLSGGPCGGRSTGHARAAAGRAGRRASTWLSRPPASQPRSTWRRPAGGGDGAGRRCAFLRAVAQLCPPLFLLGGAVSGSGVEETPTGAQSRVPGRRSARVPTVWPARAPRPQWARGVRILSR